MHGKTATRGFNKQSEVWLLDDDLDVLRYLGIVVESMGVRTRCFQNSTDLFNQGIYPVPACILVDWLLPQPDGLRVADLCRQRWPQSAVILISGQATVALAVEAMRHGLSGVVEKNLPQEDFVREIELALVPPQPIDSHEDAARRAQRKIANLSARQLEILKQLATGLPNKTIALRMKLALRTIEKERSALFSTLGVASAAEASGLLAIAENAQSLVIAMHQQASAETAILHSHLSALDHHSPGSTPLS